MKCVWAKFTFLFWKASLEDGFILVLILWFFVLNCRKRRVTLQFGRLWFGTISTNLWYNCSVAGKTPDPNLIGSVSVSIVNWSDALELFKKGRLDPYSMVWHLKKSLDYHQNVYSKHFMLSSIIYFTPIPQLTLILVPGINRVTRKLR